ncbi:hypothetical protein [Streptomyces prasinopilosus]|uniref:Uncharacterized protein n=1 Tax=Streptomyces prasinopilosus TaxID=67344 RepID=A0A1G6QZP0_9ACTN|nr:hypothetical protein [Streptomyces prasinopilosus]SDC97126.1 hypothetical protein SAMN05216505_104301 [Streptomyces prasinopilosus]
MTDRTPAEQALARSYTTGDGSTRFADIELSVEHRPGGAAVLAYRLTVERAGREGERWAVALPWEDSSFADVLASPAPDPERLQQLVHLVHALLEEWWDTKRHNRQSAKMGHRLP